MHDLHLKVCVLNVAGFMPDAWAQLYTVIIGVGLGVGIYTLKA